MTQRLSTCVLTLLLVGFCGLADAQPRLDVSGGVRWSGAVRFGSVSANETAAGGTARPLFSTSTALDASVGTTVGVGVRLSRQLRATTSVSYSATHLSTAITGDTEGAAGLTAKEDVKQFVFDAGLQTRLSRWERPWASPFVSAGVGYLRQLNAGRTLVQSGQTAYIGAGLYYVEASRRLGRIRATGVRGEVRAVGLRGGVAPDHQVRLSPAVSASVFAWF